MDERIPLAFERLEENMSLVDRLSTACVMLDKHREPDGEGGFKTTWTEGAKFYAAATLDTSIEARTAEKQGVTNIYTVTTGRNVKLEYHDVFKRLYDEKIFRVTSDGDDKYTPEGAGLDMRQVTAEEWSVTS